ncbi:phage tail protein [Taibaiella soli]|uniref:Phage tail protein n=1 Tax=Taibaiella soli TaxID=1649169 RepID=A0A2W2C2W2_9BACT|nr:tail fiber protein [Taibaiella soli]PZF74453.1 phage tail protein [Taibaiella soli]
MDNVYVGEIRIFSMGFAPKGWALCNGQLLSIQQNQALFSLLGTTYGGNGTTTFQLPDMRGRVALNSGRAQSGTIYNLGENAGTENVTLQINNLPMHNHVVAAITTPGTIGNPVGGFFANSQDATFNGVPVYVPSGQNVIMNPGAITNTGGNQPHNNMQPSLVTNFCIALQGVYPSRS